jgi:ATP-binding cassette subfamily B (MDR/TAP) protein 1
VDDGEMADTCKQPLLANFFGNLTQSLVKYTTALDNVGLNDTLSANSTLVNARIEFQNSVGRNASYLAIVGKTPNMILIINTHNFTLPYIGLGVFFCTFVYMSIWVYTGEKNSRRIRENYFRAVVHQDIVFFDDVGPGEIASRIQNDTRESYLLLAISSSKVIVEDLIQQATSEKVAIITHWASAFVSGWTVAYIHSWRLTLVLTGMLFWILGQGAILTRFITKPIK